MKNQLHKDKKKRKLGFDDENKKIVLKSIYKNTNLPKIIRWNSGVKFTEMTKAGFASNFVNRCVMTGRKKQINKIFRFSRLSFLKLARNGFISGVSKSTW
jgi:ribosomal protein S14|tara:strand:- start:7861 stop:8160 length:300 start_codon:yes stop_codon:yes gene_type:complete